LTFTYTAKVDGSMQVYAQHASEALCSETCTYIALFASIYRCQLNTNTNKQILSISSDKLNTTLYKNETVHRMYY